MKTCGYCGKEYDEGTEKCPVCGSTMLRHTTSAESAAEEYARIRAETERKRKNRSMVLIGGAVAIILAIVFLISGIVGFFNDPQRAIAKESKSLLSQAEQQVDDGEYDDALDTLNRIDTDWDDYEKVDDVRLEAVKGQLKAKLAEYEAAGNYQAIISMINENVTDINADAEVKAAYESAVQNYKAEAISSAEEYAAAGDYTSARSALTVAQNFIGEDVEISEKLKEINQKEVLEVVLSYEAAGNYKDAIVYLNENSTVVSCSADLQAKLSAYTEKYRTNVISEAESEYKANGYEAALSVLNSALQILSNDSVLFSEMEKYENLAPVNIHDLKVFYSDFDGSGGQKKTYQTLNDKLGNTYENCLEYKWGRENSEDVYILSGEYVRFEGTLFVPESRDNQGDNFNGHTAYQTMYFSIYGDGKLLYKSPEMGVKQYPVEISINVSGIQQLTIMWYAGASTWDCEIGLADAYLYKD